MNGSDTLVLSPQYMWSSSTSTCQDGLTSRIAVLQQVNVSRERPTASRAKRAVQERGCPLRRLFFPVLGLLPGSCASSARIAEERATALFVHRQHQVIEPKPPKDVLACVRGIPSPRSFLAKADLFWS